MHLFRISNGLQIYKASISDQNIYNLPAEINIKAHKLTDLIRETRRNDRNETDPRQTGSRLWRCRNSIEKKRIDKVRKLPWWRRDPVARNGCIKKAIVGETQAIASLNPSGEDDFRFGSLLPFLYSPSQNCLVRFIWDQLREDIDSLPGYRVTGSRPIYWLVTPRSVGHAALCYWFTWCT